MSKNTELEKYQGEETKTPTENKLQTYPYMGQPLSRRGRPLKYKTALALKKRIEEYFDFCNENGIPYTMSGLALSLGMTRETLLKYESNEFYGYGDLIGKAKTRIENYAETLLFGKKNCIGAIFALKNNFPGWIEKQETKVTGPLGSILDQIHASSKNIIRTKTEERGK